MRRSILLACLLICHATGKAQLSYKDDFAAYWNLINENFAYFHLQKTDWEKVKKHYQAEADTINSKTAFVRFLEKVNHELYNGHISLNTNLPSSNKLIPSGSDLWVIYKHKKYFISSVRQGHNADRAGLKQGMQVVKYNGLPIDIAIAPFLPKSVENYDSSMYEYAVNTLLAGTHDVRRTISINTNGKEQTYTPDDLNFNLKDLNPSELNNNVNDQTLIESMMYSDKIAYIKIFNSLGNADLIQAFDTILRHLEGSKALILDLRETPGGGNTTVARAIMGRFIDRELSYQKHAIPGEERQYGIRRSWLELVTPRGRTYKKPLIILVNRWTGSMGEGIAIGFDGMKRAAIVGDRMAGLLGANYSFTLSYSKIGFSFPGEQLFHVNGTPRESFVPTHFETDYNKQLALALNLLRGKY